MKPEFWTDEKVVELSAWGRLLAIGLLNFADDYGRMVKSEKRIKMQIFPADSVSVQALLTELEQAGFIYFYTVKSVEYLQIRNFTKHQRVNRPSHSPIPAPEGGEPSVSPQEESMREGKGMEGKGRERSKSRAVALPPDFGLNPDRETYARSKGIADPKTQMESFRAHHEAHGKTMLDWNAAWRTWCLNAKKFAGRNTQPEAPRTKEFPA